MTLSIGHTIRQMVPNAMRDVARVPIFALLQRGGLVLGVWRKGGKRINIELSSGVVAGSDRQGLQGGGLCDFPDDGAIFSFSGPASVFGSGWAPGWLLSLLPRKNPPTTKTDRQDS